MRRWIALLGLFAGCAFDAGPGGGGAQSTLGDTDGTTASFPGSGSEAGQSTMTTGAPTTASSMETTTSESDSTQPTDSSDSEGPPTGTEGGSESSGSTTGQTRGLTDAGVVVRYFLNEADAGTGPRVALDSTAAPVDLVLDYAGGTMQYVEELGNRGLEFTDAGSDDGARATIMGTELAGLDGVTSLTFEVVVRIDDSHNQGSRIIHFGAGGSSGVATLATDDPEQMQFAWNDDVVRTWDFSAFSGVARVVHLVVDTTAANPASQVRLLVGGAELVPEITGNIPPGDPAVVPPGTIFALGNRDVDRALDGVLFYAAVYGGPMDDGRIAQHVTALGMSND